MARKATLKATTATAALEKGIKATGELVTLKPHGKNEPDLIAENVIKSEVMTAFAEIDQSDKLMGTATQRLAHAVMAKHERLVFDGASVGPLAEAMDSAKAKANLIAHLGFLPEKPKVEKTAIIGTAERAFNKHRQLLNRAVDLAAVLSKRKIGMDQFNAKAGYWNVLGVHLFTKDVTPLGQLGGKVVMLDNRGYGGTKGTNGETFVKVYASIAQFVATAATPKPAATNQTNAGQGKTGATDNALTETLKTAKVTDIANALPLSKAVVVLHTLFVKDKPANATWTTLGDTIRNLMTDIVKTCDAINQATAAKANDKSAA